ncbi:Hypothetical protein FKW44_006651 [Caligus rogercresseyi]|uniref:Uncharacterized protein n=1 Tax=Caligus rogercresseyi TaxID=217165 RepID=A0A7T8KDL9_CALRO|nr:Hypothetical protein FKW44_006651 [Caligus rogercresseyi]
MGIKNKNLDLWTCAKVFNMDKLFSETKRRGSCTPHLLKTFMAPTPVHALMRILNKKPRPLDMR